MILPTEAICWPPITPTVTKSPITSASTKIEPMISPVRLKGSNTCTTVCHGEAPLSRAASSRLRSMRIIELKIGTIMNIVYRCTKASTTEKSENSSHSTGWSTRPAPISVWLTRPLRPSSGTQEIIRMTLLVQKGTVQMMNSTVCISVPCTWKARNQAIEKPSAAVIAQVSTPNFSVDR